MPIIKIRDTELFYLDTGVDPVKETIVFAHGLLWDNEMFAPQIDFLKQQYRCIAFDFRGQGQSPATKSGYDMENLTEDTVELISQLVDGPVHFLGLSMGGFIGMRIAINKPEMLKSLMLLETTADPEPDENKPKYLILCFVAKWISVSLIVEKTMAIMISQSFLNDPEKTKLRKEWASRLKKLNRWTITRAIKGVINRKGVFDSIGKITTPTLIVVGDEDVATVPAKAHRMNQAIKHSHIKIIQRAGHTSSIEQPETIIKTVSGFLKSI